MDELEIAKLKRRVWWAGFRNGLRRVLLRMVGRDQRERRIWLVFLGGAFHALAIVMMRQDWYGLEGYIEKVRDSWIGQPYSTLLSLAILGVGWAIVIVALLNKWSMGEDQEGAGGEGGAGPGEAV